MAKSSRPRLSSHVVKGTFQKLIRGFWKVPLRIIWDSRYHLVIVHIDFSKNSLWGKRSRPRLSSHVAAGQTLSLPRPPRRIHTHISSAGLVTRLESKKDNIKDCVFEQKTFVKTSSWLFSFEQFAKCLLSKEGEALRKWDMTSLSWSKNFTLDLLIFLASW